MDTTLLKIKRKIQQDGNGEDNIKEVSFFEITEKILHELLEDCQQNEGTPQVITKAIRCFITDIYKKISELKTKDYTHSPELLLFSNLQEYFTFNIFFDNDRRYCSKRENFKGLQKEEFESEQKTLPQRFKHIIELLNDPSYQPGTKPNYDIISILCAHLYRNINQNLNEPIPVNQYDESDILTWNRQLKLKDDNIYEYANYPFCDYLRLNDNETIIMVIVTKLNNIFIDKKVKEFDQLEAAHLLIFKSPDFYTISENKLNFVKLMKHCLAYLTYANLISNAEAVLNITAGEQQAVTRYWFYEGIEKLFAHEKILSGMDLARMIVENLLCANIKELRKLEIYPFDRVFIFPGSNFRAVKKNDSSGEYELEFYAMEAGIKSKRPQDNGRFLTSLERLENTSDIPVHPNLGQEFNLTHKKITISSYYKIDKTGNFKGTGTPSGETSELKIEYQSKDEDVREKELDFIGTLVEELRNFRWERITKSSDKQNCIIASLYTGLYRNEIIKDLRKDKSYENKSVKDISSIVDGKLQEICQQTYNFYTSYGLCFIDDFAGKFDDLQILDTITIPYFKTLEQENCEKWEALWKDVPENIPDIDKFTQWKKKVQRKIALISYDPSQDTENMDQKGNRYLDPNKYGFTILLIQDEVQRKNNYQILAESENLLQLFTMITGRLIQLEKLKKETIREQKSFFKTLMPSVMHRVKNYVPEQKQKDEIENMMKDISKLFVDEDFTFEIERIVNAEQLYKYFMSNFIEEQLNIKVSDFTYKSVSVLMDEACKKYMERKISELKLNISAKTLKVYVGIDPPDNFHIKTHKNFVHEAIKIILNNALEHTAIYANKEKATPEISIFFNIVPLLLKEDNSAIFDITVVNSSYHLSAEKLKIINSAEPTEIEKDASKTTSTGIGLFIARKQLRNVIGKEADIRLMNLGKNKVAAKILLPASILSLEEQMPEKKQRTKAEAITHNEKYILYVEDDKKNREASEIFLAEIAPKTGCIIHAVDNYQDAIAKMKAQSPQLILMDLTILKSSGSTELGQKWGLKTLKEALENQDKIPIILITGSSENEVKDILIRNINIEKCGYKYEGKISKDKELQNHGIYLTNMKQLNAKDAEDVRIIINKWAEIHSEKKYEKEKKISSVDTSEEVNSVEYNLTDKEFNKELENYRVRNITDGLPGEVFVTKYIPKDISDLCEALSKWLLHPGIKSFYPDEQNETELYPISSNESYKTILFLINSEKLTDVIDIKLRYWGLSHNMLFSKKKKVSKQIYARWKNSSHGFKGPLSILRHDLKNKLQAEELQKLLTHINRLESALLFDNQDFFVELDDLLKTNKQKAVNILSDNKFYQPIFALHESLFEDTTKVLRMVAENSQERKELEHSIKVIENLHDFLIL